MTEGSATFLVLAGVLLLALAHFRWYEAPFFRAMDWFGLLEEDGPLGSPRWFYYVAGTILFGIGAAALVRRLLA